MKTKFETVDGKLFDNVQDAEIHEKNLNKKDLTRYEKYLNTFFGESLLKKHSLDEYGIWEILGEDPNCDFGGPHYNPKLGFLEGRLDDILKKAVGMKGFWSWGGGGEIRKISIEKI